MKWRHEPKRELMEEADEDMEQEIARTPPSRDEKVPLVAMEEQRVG